VSAGALGMITRENRTGGGISDEQRRQYTQFCAEHPDIPIFSQPWWLDAVCPEQWDVILIEEGAVTAVFPYYKRRTKKGISRIEMPPLTQKLGPFMVYEANMTKESKRINYEHKIYNKIIEQIPEVDDFRVCFDWKYKNWLPFYWAGYTQTTRYTYIIENLDDYDAVFAHISPNKKQPIKKAQNVLTLQYDLSADEFYQYFTEAIQERGEKVSFSKELFTRMYNAVYQHNAGRVFYCIDSENNIHAINMIVWDTENAYYLLAMRKKAYNTSGGTEFLVNETIKYVSQFVNRFDFEGSMIKGVEESYRQYGARQTEYYAVSKCDNLALRVLRAIKD
jgi:hypothetical protein